MKVDVCDIEWESYEGDDYDEEYGEGNDKGWPDCDCPTTVTLDIDVPDDASDDDIDEALSMESHFNEELYNVAQILSR